VSADLEDLLQLAERFAARGSTEIASELLRIASALEPGSERVRSLLATAGVDGGASGEDALLRQRERSSIDACHFAGLAELYAERGEIAAAVECLQMAKEKSRTLPQPYKLYGRILILEKDYDGAARELRKALRFNPFDREVAEMLGQVEYEQKRFAEALAATVDAYLLLGDEETGPTSRLRRRIRTLKRVLDWDNRAILRLFHERQEFLTTAFDRLQWRRDLFLEEHGLADKGLFGGRSRDRGGARIALASRLREQELWSHLPDEAIFQLSQVVEEESHDGGDVLFVAGSVDSDLFLVERGRVEIQRTTPYGFFSLRTLGRGELFGEPGFVSSVPRSGDAVVAEPSRLLHFDGIRLRRLIEDLPDLGLEIYSGLWRSLAKKLRTSNEHLRTFVPGDSVEAIPENVAPIRGSEALAERVAAQVDRQDKIRLFREQGLSRAELLTLATFSRERNFADGAYLFREGDAGDEMYAILDGQVRISKAFSAGAEEALSILGRGDFFGEMSLIDGQPRSADARAHGGQVTVLALDQATLSEVLVMDPQAALEFLELLCRLLATRLREVDEKLTLWQILSAHEDSARGA
jgi:CRP-like cAMP-binding protein